MKKLISVLLALVLCCMMIPAMAESDSMAGVWYIGHATINGEPVVVYDPEAITMALLEDGTGVLTITAAGAQTECKWTYADSTLTMTVEGQGDLEYPVVDGEIKLSQAPVDFYMTLTPDDTPVDLPAAMEAESVEAFNGKWDPSKTIAYGILANVADIFSGTNSVASLQIEDGKVSFVLEDTEPTTIECTLENGVLAGTDAYGSAATFTLLEDGSLMYTYSQGGMAGLFPSTYFFVPAEEAAE